MLLSLIVGILIMNILLSVAVPRAHRAVQREKETQLRFVQAEVRRAARKFQLEHGRFSVSLDELLADGQGRRYLRRVYLDPISSSDDWLTETGSDGVRVFSPSLKKSLSGRPYAKFQ